MRRRSLFLLVAGVVHAGSGVSRAQTSVPSAPGRYRIEILSRADGSFQPSILTLPAHRASEVRLPLAVVLHTWSYDLEQRDSALEAEIEQRGWLLLAPNFRGRNDRPSACGSPLAQQDIVDAVEWVRAHYMVDEQRIYVLGMSGGGHMTMLIAAQHPELWTAASAWVGISDLRAWYDAHAGDDYGTMMRACLGTRAVEGERVDREFRARSPLSFLGTGLTVPMDLAAGRYDSSVSIAQTLRAFRALAPGSVSDSELAELLGSGPGLARATVRDTATDTLLGRRIFLRRVAGGSRVTIFEGGHEWVPHAAVSWLAAQQRPTMSGVRDFPHTVQRDPAPAIKPPASMTEVAIPSGGARMNGIVYLAAGEGAHPVVIFLHGYPGNERNLDLAQAVRRAGYHAVYVDYRGSWGSGGTFSFSHALEDAAAVVAWVRAPRNAERYHFDVGRIAVVGHSFGGWLALMTAGRWPPAVCVAAIAAWNVGFDVQRFRAHPDERDSSLASFQTSTAPGGPIHASATALQREITAHALDWDYLPMIPAFADHALLLAASTRDTPDEGIPMHEQVARVVRAEGGEHVTLLLFDDDHAFSSHRVALAQVLTDWLGADCAATQRPAP